MFGNFSLFGKKTAVNSKVAEAESYKYCPLCGDEYRADISQCAACEVELVSGGGEGKNGISSEQLPRKLVKITSGDELATVKRGVLAEVKSLQRLLEKEGVDSIIAGEGGDCGKGCCNSSAYDLNVRVDDFNDAQKIMAEDFRRTTGLAEHDYTGSAEAVFDERLDSVSCPACSFRFVPSEQSVCPECGLCF